MTWELYYWFYTDFTLKSTKIKLVEVSCPLCYFKMCLCTWLHGCHFLLFSTWLHGCHIFLCVSISALMKTFVIFIIFMLKLSWLLLKAVNVNRRNLASCCHFFVCWPRHWYRLSALLTWAVLYKYYSITLHDFLQGVTYSLVAGLKSI